MPAAGRGGGRASRAAAAPRPSAQRLEAFGASRPRSVAAAATPVELDSRPCRAARAGDDGGGGAATVDGAFVLLALSSKLLLPL